MGCEVGAFKTFLCRETEYSQRAFGGERGNKSREFGVMLLPVVEGRLCGCCVIHRNERVIVCSHDVALSAGIISLGAVCSPFRACPRCCHHRGRFCLLNILWRRISEQVSYIHLETTSPHF